MEVRVDDVDGLPAHTYLSVRYGEQRRQAPFRAGEVIAFHPAPGTEKMPRSYTIDVLRKVGSKQVSLAGIMALGGSVKHVGLEIPSLEINGLPVTADISAKLVTTAPEEHEQTKRQQMARKAKEYLDAHKVQPVLNDMFAKLLEAQPSDPLAFMVDFLEQQRESAAEDCEDFASLPGLGATPLPGFADGRSSEDLPDLLGHHSLAAEVLRAEPELYERLRDARTELGVSLAQCAKSGIDCPGHALMKVAGAFAGDAESYDRYWALFGPIVSGLHPGWSAEVSHTAESNPAKLTNSSIDASGRYAVYASLDVRRNLCGFRFPPCCSKAERREVERFLTAAGARGLRGTYLPLRGSGSCASMTLQQQRRLRSAGLLFSAPDSRLRLSAGLGRDWPDARGVFLSESQGLCVWCNEEDHLRFVARQHGAVDLKRLWSNLVEALAAVGQGGSFARSDRLGYLTACPTRLGAAMRATVALRLPLLAAATDLPALCASMDLQVSQEVGPSGSLWGVSSGEGLGVSEVDLLNNVIEGCRRLVSLEARLEAGAAIFDATPGLGDEAAPGFPSRTAPATLPDLGQHCSVAAQVLRAEPQLYARLRRRATGAGVPLAACLKPGIDHSSGAGLVAGDEECYEVFRDLFGPVIRRINDGFLPTVPQPRDTSVLKVANGVAGSISVELRRNLSGLRFAPCCSASERREVERLVVGAALSLGARYAPLSHSQSYTPLRGTEDAFGPPCPRGRSAGLGRHWPDARGAVLGADFTVFINEEDHLRLVVRQEGLKAALGRALDLEALLLRSLEAQGARFAVHPLLGFLTVDPRHLGAALRCSATLLAPKLLERPLEALGEALHLRLSRGEGLLELSTGACLGISEVDLANELLDGCAQLLDLEEAFHRDALAAEHRWNELLRP